MPALPVSAAAIVLRSPDGTDDMLLAEFFGPAIAAAIVLLDRLAEKSIDAASLPVADFEHMLLRLYASRFGQVMMLGFVCPACRAIAEVTFRVSDLLASARPRVAPGIVPDPKRPGWFRLGAACFRLPTASDQAAALASSDPYRHLCDRCLDEAAKTPPHRARVERAMQAMAPPLSRAITAHCPSCGSQVRAWLSVPELVVTELRRAAGAVHEEVDLIARAYHWPESQILALPEPRRRAYAERIRKAA